MRKLLCFGNRYYVLQIVLVYYLPIFMLQVANGCMWFVPGSHKQLLKKHRPVAPGHHVLMTDECTNVSQSVCWTYSVWNLVVPKQEKSKSNFGNGLIWNTVESFCLEI